MPDKYWDHLLMFCIACSHKQGAVELGQSYTGLEVNWFQTGHEMQVALLETVEYHSHSLVFIWQVVCTVSPEITVFIRRFVVLVGKKEWLAAFNLEVFKPLVF